MKFYNLQGVMMTFTINKHIFNRYSVLGNRFHTFSFQCYSLPNQFVIQIISQQRPAQRPHYTNNIACRRVGRKCCCYGDENKT